MILFAVAATSGVAIFGCDSDWPIWAIRSDTADPLYRFVERGKAGYIDQTGKVVIPPRFEASGNYGGEFHEGILGVDDSYIDTRGRRVTFKGLMVWGFSEGLALAKVKGTDKLGYIDHNGKFVIPPQFGPSPGPIFMGSFSNGMASIDDWSSGRAGFIDRKGSVAIPMRFLKVFYFSDERAWVVAEGPCLYVGVGGGCPDIEPLPRSAGFNQQECKFALIDKSGTIITEKRFDAVKVFSEGLAPVRFGDKWGFVDVSGATIIQPKFSDAESFSNGLAVVSMDGHYGYINHDGEFAIPPQFISADTFSDGFALVGDGQKGTRYIDRSGKTAIAGHFIWGSRFYKGLAHVKLSDRKPDETILYRGDFAYIDHSGRIVFKYRR